MRLAWLLIVLAPFSGCAGARWFDRHEEKSPTSALAKASAAADGARPGWTPVRVSGSSTDSLVDPAPPTAPQNNDHWQQALERLRARTDLNRDTQAKLLADMEQVEPIYRPMMARMLEAVLAPPPGHEAERAVRTAQAESLPPKEPENRRHEFMPARAALAVAPITPPMPVPIVTGRDFEFAAPFTLGSESRLPEQNAANAAMAVVTDVVAAAAAPNASPAAAPAAVANPAPPPASVAKASPPATVSANPEQEAAPNETKTEAPQDWHKELQDAITALQTEIGKLPEKDAARQRLEVEVKLLQLAAGDKDAAVKGLDRLDPWQRDYWKHQFHALAVGLDDGGTPVASRRAALALRELREASSCLAVGSTLDVRNLAFCTQVDSFGRFTEFPKSEFQANQELLLYAEIDNVSVSQSSAGFESSLQGSYQILAASGERVADVTFPVETDVCRNRRRDYFIPFRLYVPKKIDPGRYTLQLTVEDLKGKKFGQGSADFTVVAQTAAR